MGTNSIPALIEARVCESLHPKYSSLETYKGNRIVSIISSFNSSMMYYNTFDASGSWGWVARQHLSPQHVSSWLHFPWPVEVQFHYWSFPPATLTNHVDAQNEAKLSEMRLPLAILLWCPLVDAFITQKEFARWCLVSEGNELRFVVHILPQRPHSDETGTWDSTKTHWYPILIRMSCAQHKFDNGAKFQHEFTACVQQNSLMKEGILDNME